MLLFENTYSFVFSRQEKQRSLDPSNSAPSPHPQILMFSPQSSIMAIESGTTGLPGLSKPPAPFQPVTTRPAFKLDPVTEEAFLARGRGLGFAPDFFRPLPFAFHARRLLSRTPAAEAAPPAVPAPPGRGASRGETPGAAAGGHRPARTDPAIIAAAA